MLDIRALSSTWGSQHTFTLEVLLGKSMKSGLQSPRLEYKAWNHSLPGPLGVTLGQSLSLPRCPSLPMRKRILKIYTTHSYWENGDKSCVNVRLQSAFMYYSQTQQMSFGPRVRGRWVSQALTSESTQPHGGNVVVMCNDAVMWQVRSRLFYSTCQHSGLFVAASEMICFVLMVSWCMFGCPPFRVLGEQHNWGMYPYTPWISWSLLAMLLGEPASRNRLFWFRRIILKYCSWSNETDLFPTSKQPLIVTERTLCIFSIEKQHGLASNSFHHSLAV